MNSSLKNNKKKSKTEKKANYNFLLYVPEIKHDNWKVVDNKVVIYFSVKDPVKRFVGWLYKTSPTCDITFDDLCSKAWLLIDGERCIYDIAKIMATECNESLDSSIHRIVPYMHHIAKKGWVSFKEVKKVG
ncbi:PqqD family peptide modification chaperone [Clostridium sardiniense]|uniref:PqqD family peptide modification chaperone n=1 Tax=Clostridium sardiniense TaxID=29369 RepID=UPI003D32A60B